MSTCPTHVQTRKHTHTHTHTHSHKHPCTTQAHTFTQPPLHHPSKHSHSHPCTTQTHAFTTQAQNHHPCTTQAHIHTTTHLSECQFSTNMAQKLVTYLILAKQHLGGQQRSGPFNFIHDRFGLQLHLQQSRGSERGAGATKLHPPQLLGYTVTAHKLCTSASGFMTLTSNF